MLRIAEFAPGNGPACSWACLPEIGLLLAQLLSHLGTLARAEVPATRNRWLRLWCGNRQYRRAGARTSCVRSTTQITPQLFARSLPVHARPATRPRLCHDSIG